jgi:5-methylcytosine-specific restriction endonuclease McrA
VETAQALAADAFLQAVVMDGQQIVSISHLGRTINARLRTALEARDQTCVVPGCYVSHNLQADHVHAVIDGGPTELANLALLCRWHHNQKTHHGYQLTGPPGQWKWSKPDPKAKPRAG